MAIEKTLLLIKPDGVQRGLTGEVLSRLEQRGLKLIGLKMMKMDESLARQHYEAHIDKDFFPSLTAFMMSSPLVAAVLEGPNAVQAARNIMGQTDPLNSASGTIRGDFAVDIGRNVVHGSDSVASAVREIELFFDHQELFNWNRAIDKWIIE